MNIFQKCKNLVKGALVASAGFVGVANAALPAEATTAFAELQADGLALIGLAWGAAGALVVGMIILGMFKRAGNKAT